MAQLSFYDYDYFMNVTKLDTQHALTIKHRREESLVVVVNNDVNELWHTVDAEWLNTGVLTGLEHYYGPDGWLRWIEKATVFAAELIKKHINQPAATATTSLPSHNVCHDTTDLTMAMFQEFIHLTILISSCKWAGISDANRLCVCGLVCGWMCVCVCGRCGCGLNSPHG